MASEANGPISTGQIDYIERWRHLVRSRVEQGRRLDSEHGRADHWAGSRAERFRRMTMSQVADPLVDLIQPYLTPSATVLDVGAGAGRHVARVASKVARVTAVEPSGAMREQLRQVVATSNLPNVEIVAGAWPSVAVEPADVVICSHVIYFVEEIAPFLQALRQVTRGHAFVVLRFVQREQAILPLFEKVWGESRVPEPSFTDLFGVAAQLGLWGNVSVVKFGFSPSFESLDEAVNMVRADLLNPTGEESERIIRDDLTQRLIPREGRLTFGLPPTYAGVLWWEAGA